MNIVETEKWLDWVKSDEDENKLDFENILERVNSLDLLKNWEFENNFDFVNNAE